MRKMDASRSPFCTCGSFVYKIISLCKFKILVQQLDHSQRRMQEKLDGMIAAGRGRRGQIDGQKALLPQPLSVPGQVLRDVADMIGTVL